MDSLYTMVAGLPYLDSLAALLPVALSVASSSFEFELPKLAAASSRTYPLSNNNSLLLTKSDGRPNPDTRGSAAGRHSVTRRLGRLHRRQRILVDLATAVKASGNVGGLVLGPFGGRMGGKEPRNADEDVLAFFRALPALVLAHPSLQVLMSVKARVLA